MEQKTNKKKTIVIVLSVLLIIGVFLGVMLGVPSQEAYADYDFMGGICLQSVVNSNRITRKSIAKDVYKAVGNIDALIDPNNTKSDVYRINHSTENEVVKVNSITIELLKYSLDIYDKSNGLFSPTVYDLVDLWGFSAEKFNNQANHVVPSQDAIDKAINLCSDFKNKFIIDEVNKTVTRKSSCFVYEEGELVASTKIDLGGIAKGYAVEKGYNVFKSSSAKDALVNLGGNIFAYNKDWKVGLRNPYYATEKEIMGVLTLNNLSVSVSGVYERNYTAQGEFYHHIINPTTGKPVALTDSSVISAAVIGTDGAICDAVATCMILSGSIENCEDFIANNFTDKIKGVVLVTKDKHYKVIGNVDFTFNDKEMVGFNKIG